MKLSWLETATAPCYLGRMPKRKPAVKSMPIEKNPAAVALGRIGGQATRAKHAPDYYRKLAAKRKHFRGGRPPKES